MALILLQSQFLLHWMPKNAEIFTDVDGVYTTDPRISKGAKKIDNITSEEMLELSSQGSKVLAEQ